MPDGWLGPVPDEADDRGFSSLKRMKTIQTFKSRSGKKRLFTPIAGAARKRIFRTRRGLRTSVLPFQLRWIGRSEFLQSGSGKNRYAIPDQNQRSATPLCRSD